MNKEYVLLFTSDISVDIIKIKIVHIKYFLQFFLKLKLLFIYMLSVCTFTLKMPKIWLTRRKISKK